MMNISDFDPKYQAERNYKCPCGKAYLSSGALYTHIKFKHEGRAPGETITPGHRSRKPRGRKPKNGIERTMYAVKVIDAEQSWRGSNVEEDKSIKIEKAFDKLTIQQQIQHALLNFKFPKKFPLQTSDGFFTCQDMASIFYRKYSEISYNVSVALSYFISQIEQAVRSRFGEDYWKNQGPDEIVECANLVCLQHRDESPLSRDQLIRMLSIFFKWMYDEKWTDHQIQKKLEFSSKP